MDAEIELEMAQGSTAQPPSATPVKLPGGPGWSQGFQDAAELISSFPHHRKARGPSQTLQTSWSCAKFLCPGCSRCPTTATCSGLWLPPLSHTLTHCRKWRWRPTLVASLRVWTLAGAAGKLGWAGGELGSMARRAGGRAKSSGHTVQMHPCPRPGHLCSLAAPGAPCLLQGPVGCILPSQGQRPPSCPVTPGHTPFSEPLTDTLQTGKGNLHPTGLWGSQGSFSPFRGLSRLRPNRTCATVPLDLESPVSA